MNADECPRSGLPENPALRLRVWLVYLSVASAFIIGIVIGALRR